MGVAFKALHLSLPARRKHGSSLSSLLRRFGRSRGSPRLAAVTACQPSCSSEGRMQHLFHAMAAGGARVTEADIQRYAEENGLPMEYVAPFFAGLVAEGSPLAAMMASVPFHTFSRYVGAREEALRRIFSTIDTDGDGFVTPHELRLGLSHITIACPNTRQTYRTCSDACARALLALPMPQCAEDGAPQRSISFCRFRHAFMLLPPEGLLQEYWSHLGDPAALDVGDRFRFQDARAEGGTGRTVSAWGHLLAGAAAGAASRTATAPLETVRLMAMTGALGSAGQGGLLAALATVVQRQGWRALYRGNGANVLRSAPQKALDFFAFDAFKSRLTAKAAKGAAPAQPSAASTFAAAGLAGAVSNAVLYPLELVRTRLTVDASGTYRGVGHAMSTIARAEGPLALYRGIVPSVIAILPEAAITYGLFDLLKRSYAKHAGAGPGVATSLAFGVASAFSGQVVAYPLESISRRMQLLPHSSVTSAAADVWRTGAMYKGLGAACLRLVPMAIISFGTYELVRQQVTRAELEWDKLQTLRELEALGRASSALALQV